MSAVRCLTCDSTAVIGTPDGGYCGACDAKVFVYLDPNAEAAPNP